MKFTFSAALAAFIGAVAAKDERTFAVLRFTNKGLTAGRMDPIVSPGKTSAHVHTIMGGSAFGTSTTGEDTVNAQCTNAKIKGDNSNYWFPSVYFHDEEADTFEPVEVFYVNAYYFFEATNDEIKAFPRGLQIVAGDAMKRTAPETSTSNLDPSKGPVQPVKWTCPRDGNNYNPPSWPADSDGTMAGMGDPVNKGEGVGFPDMGCDGYASPLRADIHFPSCYNPEAGLTDYQNNMAYPEGNDGKVDCPEGWIHVPHLFLEVYWNTPLFDGRWTPGVGKQPFVLSNGDATGFASHADFLAGWDEELLQHIIDTCDAGTAGMDNCEGLFYGVNEEDCTIPSEIDEEISGELSALPGNNPLQGWRFGLDDLPSLPIPDPSDDAGSSPKPTSSSPAETGLPEPTEAPTNIVENPAIPDSSTEEAEAEPTVAPEPTVTPEPEEPIEEEPEQPTAQPTEPATTAAPAPTSTSSCSPKVHTVWETVTVTATAYDPEATSGASSNSTGSVGGFQFAGCFKDSHERALADIIRADIGAVTNEACVTHCKGAGFLLAGTEHGGECYCGNELIGSEQLEESVCSTPCKGDAKDICGGDWALSVYSESGEASLSGSRARRHLHGHHAHGHRRSL